MQYDMEDLLDQANEVQESMSRSYGVPDELDEIDLDAGASPSPPPSLPLTRSPALRPPRAAHATPPSPPCSAISYMVHTSEGAQALLTSPRYFPSRLEVPDQGRKLVRAVARRLLRTFAHCHLCVILSVSRFRRALWAGRRHRRAAPSPLRTALEPVPLTDARLSSSCPSPSLLHSHHPHLFVRLSSPSPLLPYSHHPTLFVHLETSTSLVRRFAALNARFALVDEDPGALLELELGGEGMGGLGLGLERGFEGGEGGEEGEGEGEGYEEEEDGSEEDEEDDDGGIRAVGDASL